ncbi:MAG TPA: DUF4416 domain-containing protein [Fibrobacteres bacterium]|jgi:hypothetical protein|nr:DUF4416 domain-containing protein [Fibrobacterota bacterium]
MGNAQLPLKVKLFLAILFRPDVNRNGLFEKIEKKFGKAEFLYGPIGFSFSDYYKDEMGPDLLKWYIVFEPLIDRDRLPEIKVFTNSMEHEKLLDDKRKVNLDPGYITRDKLVLASTKDFYHRLYLGEGIYGEVTLHFRKGVFRNFSWTYPDYKDEKFLDFLMKARAKYMHEIRED